jgi:hypothetical protein
MRQAVPDEIHRDILRRNHLRLSDVDYDRDAGFLDPITDTFLKQEEANASLVEAARLLDIGDDTVSDLHNWLQISPSDVDDTVSALEKFLSETTKPSRIRQFR